MVYVVFEWWRPSVLVASLPRRAPHIIMGMAWHRKQFVLWFLGYLSRCEPPSAHPATPKQVVHKTTERHWCILRSCQPFETGFVTQFVAEQSNHCSYGISFLTSPTKTGQHVPTVYSPCEDVPEQPYNGIINKRWRKLKNTLPKTNISPKNGGFQ